MSTPIDVASRDTQTITTSGDYDPVTVEMYGELDIRGAGVSVTLSDVSLNEATVGIYTNSMAVLESVTSNNASGFNIGTNAVLEEAASLTTLQPATFLTATGTLRIDGIGQSLNTGFVTLFHTGDRIAFAEPVTSFTYTQAQFGNEGTLVVDNGTTMLASLGINGSYTQNSFVINSDGSLGVACFVAGTRIDTPAGEVAVEALAAGDLVMTVSGAARPVKWVGQRGYHARFVAANPALRPIRFRAGCLGAGLPLRDLMVSPEHAMFLDSVLVPARALVNGVTIVQDGVARVEYYHVELDTHDLILAEGAPTETFLDDDSRGVFHNASEFASRYPDAPEQPAAYCAPRIDCGYALQAIRNRLAPVAIAA